MPWKITEQGQRLFTVISRYLSLSILIIILPYSLQENFFIHLVLFREFQNIFGKPLNFQYFYNLEQWPGTFLTEREP